MDLQEAQRYRQQSEIAFNRYLFASASDWIRNNPLRFAHLTAKRIWSFWLSNAIIGGKSWLRLMYFGPLLALAVCGVFVGIARRWHLAPVWLFLVIFPLPYYVTHVMHGRYSYPVEPFVALLAAIPVGIWFARNSQATSFQHAGANEQPGHQPKLTAVHNTAP